MSVTEFAVQVLNLDSEVRSLRAENARLRAENECLWQEHVGSYLANDAMLHNTMLKVIQAVS